MMQQKHGDPVGGAYRPGSLELVIALGSLALIIGIGIGVILNQSVQSASVSDPAVTARPTRSPKATPRVKPTAQPGAISRRAKPTAQAAKPTSAPQSTRLAPTSVPPTAAPAPTSAPPAATAITSPAYIEYTVQKGDNLFNLAKAYGVTQDEILSINTIKNPRSLTVGQVIRIPKK